MSFPYYKKGIFTRRLSNRAWFSLALLFVIVPVGSLTTFRLTGTLKEPQKPKTTPLEAVSWNMSRPTQTVTVNEWTENSYMDGEVSAGSGINVVGYNELVPGEGPPFDNDFLTLHIRATANVSYGFIFSIVVRFSESDTSATVVFQQTSAFMEFHNLRIQRIRDLDANGEALFETTAPDQPNNTLLAIVAYWSFLDENITDHWTTINVEATYFDGTAYQRLVMPIRLGVLVG